MIPALLQQIGHQALSGRVIARQLPDNQEVLVGVLQFPHEFKPKEGALHLAVYAGAGIYVLPDVLAADLPDEIQGMGIGSALRTNCWRKTNAVGTLTVRFVEAFPESNHWTVYGPSNQPLFQPSLYQRGHAALKIADGVAEAMDPPEGLHGHEMSQLLRDMPLWPDAKGVLHTVPVIDARWREKYLEHSLLQARVGAGEITEKEFVDAVRADPQLFQIRSLSQDQKYLTYLAALRDLGGIEIESPRTAEQVESRRALNQQALAKSLGEDIDTPREVLRSKMLLGR